MSSLQIITTSLPSAVPGEAYAAQVEAFGGWYPYVWTFTGTLPPGLSLSPTGLISGVPTNIGSYHFSATATDSNSSGSTSVTETYLITVASAVSPALNDHFNSYYDLYSISRYDFVIPDHFDVYAPEYDNEIDFQCLSVITPNPDKGAKQWTYQGKWLTIGVYRDEGRDPEQRQPRVSLSWTRSGTVLRIVDNLGHKLRTGDKVNIYSTNIEQNLALLVTVLNSTVFTVVCEDTGGESGFHGAYQPTDLYIFSEQNYVFRLLPSFALVPWSLIRELFVSSAPDSTPQSRELWNITTNSSSKLPRGISRSTNFNVPTNGQSSSKSPQFAKRFDQVYDEAGVALKVSYKPDGQPVSSKNYDSKYLSKNSKFNAPLINEDVAFGDFFRITHDNDYRVLDTITDTRVVNLPRDDAASDTRVYVYDFYGHEINDPRRGPYFSTDLIVRDELVDGIVNNIARAGQNSTAYYSKKLYDIFNNLVYGIQYNNATVIRQNLLPLELDRYNRPVKLPLKRVNSSGWVPSPTVTPVPTPQPTPTPIPQYPYARILSIRYRDETEDYRFNTVVNNNGYANLRYELAYYVLELQPSDETYFTSKLYPIGTQDDEISASMPSIESGSLLIIQNNYNTLSDDSILAGTPSIVSGLLLETVIYFTSTIYPVIVSDSIVASSPGITFGHAIERPNEFLVAQLPSVVDGSLITTISYVTYTNPDEAITASIPTITSGTLITTISYVTYTNPDEAITASNPTITSGTLT